MAIHWIYILLRETAVLAVLNSIILLVNDTLKIIKGYENEV
jgi:hypothetical protein